MPNITMSIPEDLHEKMKTYSELKWTNIIRDLIEKKIKELEESDYRLYTLSKMKDSEGAEDLFEF